MKHLTSEPEVSEYFLAGFIRGGAAIVETEKRFIVELIEYQGSEAVKKNAGGVREKGRA